MTGGPSLQELASATGAIVGADQPTWADVVTAIATAVLTMVALGVAFAEWRRFCRSRDTDDYKVMRQWQAEAAWLDIRLNDISPSVVVTNRGPRPFMALNLVVERAPVQGSRNWRGSHNELRKRIRPGETIDIPIWNDQNPMLAGQERPTETDLATDFRWRLFYGDNEERRWVRIGETSFGPRMIEPRSEWEDELLFINRPPKYVEIRTPSKRARRRMARAPKKNMERQSTESTTDQ